jgi:sugar O-acyltransferase (sialic acid O-acetyltransferase NeuD family)
VSSTYIVGAGGFGREVLRWARDAGIDVDAFLDTAEGVACGLPILPDDLVFSPRDVFLCGIGEPALKRIVCERLRSRGARFWSLVHPTAIVTEPAAMGEGCVICPHAILSVGSSIGRFVTVNCAATVGHDTVTGDYCSISSHADICGHASLGEGVLVGSHASILPHAHAGDWSIVGSGSVVVREAPERSTVMGVPAAVIYRKPQ